MKQELIQKLACHKEVYLQQLVSGSLFLLLPLLQVYSTPQIQQPALVGLQDLHILGIYFV